MYTSVAKLIAEGKLGQWVEMSDEERQCVIDSIPGENMLRNAPLNRMDGSSQGDNLRHYIDRGYIVVLSGPSMEAEPHPLGNLKLEVPSQEELLLQGSKEKSVFASG